MAGSRSPDGYLLRSIGPAALETAGIIVAVAASLNAGLCFSPAKQERGTTPLQEVEVNRLGIKGRVAVVLLFLAAFSHLAHAGQWKRVCPEGGICNGFIQFFGPGTPTALDRHAYGPLAVGDHIWFQYFRSSEASKSFIDGAFEFQDSDTFLIDTHTGALHPVVGGPSNILDGNSVALPGGSAISANLAAAQIISPRGEILEEINWLDLQGESSLSLGVGNAWFIGPPVYVAGGVYMGLATGGGSNLYLSSDGGYTWAPQRRTDGGTPALGADRFNLLTNPAQTHLWSIESERNGQAGGLWESYDFGASWTRVDDGSFPQSTVRIVHDPIGGSSYALARDGLFVSFTEGISWQGTTLTERVHGLVFVDRIEPLSRAMIVGTDTGAKVSVDEGASWSDFSAGLLKIPHTLTYSNGTLVAMSDAGYFTCNTVDCSGIAQKVPESNDGGLVDVVEFYNTDLKHYFITADEGEAVAIDNGAAGPGWERTGQSFRAWSLLGSNEASPVCRFYGSTSPGPNSHFFSVSPGECGFLQRLQAETPPTEPRWNFEGYAFMAKPTLDNGEGPCAADDQPVYRAYNGGFSRGLDSNHRYVTDRALLDPLLANGWTDEGVAFCAHAPAAQ